MQVTKPLTRRSRRMHTRSCKIGRASCTRSRARCWQRADVWCPWSRSRRRASSGSAGRAPRCRTWALWFCIECVHFISLDLIAWLGIGREEEVLLLRRLRPKPGPMCLRLMSRSTHWTIRRPLDMSPFLRTTKQHVEFKYCKNGQTSK